MGCSESAPCASGNLDAVYEKAAAPKASTKPTEPETEVKAANDAKEKAENHAKITDVAADVSSSSPSSSTEPFGFRQARVRLTNTTVHSNSSTQGRASKKSKTGLSEAVALRASAVAEQRSQERLEEARRRRAEEAAKRRERDEEALLRHSQDQEFQQSLLMDQLKDLIKRQGPLKKELEALDAEVEEAEKVQKHAAQRLAQFGGVNPKLAEKSERAAERLAVAAEQRPDMVAELEQIETDILEKNELLAAMLA